jgi:hypothetical protein
MKLTDDKKKNLLVFLPDTRGVEISPYGQGNLKLGPTVYTYSRVAGQFASHGTCPGSTPECEDICYAKRIVGPVHDNYVKNSLTSDVPAIPGDCELLRIHVSGDFDSLAYIMNWHLRLLNRPEVTAWAYTRSWRVPELLPALEILRGLDNLQLFASMDISAPEMPPAGWRIAWIDGDPRAGTPTAIEAHSEAAEAFKGVTIFRTATGTKTLICPEETKSVANCEECKYCFDGLRNDVTFLRH